MFLHIRSNPTVCRTIVGLLICSMIWLVMKPYEAIAQQTVTIPAGTVVTFRTSNAISPKVYHVGDNVHLTVAYDVVVDNHVVIKAGTAAKAEVIESRNKGPVGQAAKIAISLRRVDAVDGTTIPLYGTRLAEGDSNVATAVIVTILCCVLGLLIHGGEAELPSGTEIQAESAGSTEVTLSQH